MKRSEMVEEIRKILEMNGKDNGYGELEEALLHHIETLGMKPPHSDKVYQKEVMVYIYPDGNQWEPEDDQ